MDPNRTSLPHVRLSALGATLALVLFVAAPAAAVHEPLPDPLHALVRAPAGFVATPAPEPLAAIAAELGPAALADVQAFQADAGGTWRVWVDRRSGLISLAEGGGVPWIGPGGATLAGLETRARQLIAAYPGMLGVSGSQLELDPAASGSLGDDGQHWNLTFRQTIGGIPIAGSALVFRISHGNLVQMGATRVLPDTGAIAGVVPALDAAGARAALAAYVGGLVAGDLFAGDGSLEWALRGTGDAVGYGGPVGGGWVPHLVWRVTLLRDGSAASWTGLVDAVSGELLRFADSTDYASVIKGSVYPSTNCADPSSCVPGSATEVPVTMPNASLVFSDGSTGYANSAGAFDYPSPLALTAVSTLSGRYFTTVDACGPVAVTGLGVQTDLDAGTTRLVPPPLNTDCVPADSESAPASGPLTGGLGDTHAVRSAYYHLNLINQKSRFYLPDNDWLKGVDGSLGPTLLLTNGPPVCNAFWQGGTQTLAFFRQTPGLACNNTGEIAGVFLHEFGHGLDQHDGTGTAPESATGEAMGDTFSLLQTQQSCVGPGFRLPDPLDPEWGNSAGYGTGSRLCSGVRDMDYTRFCRRGDAGECAAPTDPDEVNGSRSGPNPPPEPAGEYGTPARWDTMLSAGGGADGVSSFYNCGGPETTGCAGPLNHGCHCESLIASQSNWDLAKALITEQFGGNPYGVQGPVEVSGWQTMDRLWYLSRDIAISGYSVTGPYPEGTTNGCSATDWFSAYRFVDDDDGDLANGTPHADLIFSAFDLHATACGAAGDPSNQATACPAPVAAPTLSAVCSTAPVQLTWSAAAGAARYRVLRNTLGCEFGFTPLATVSAGRTYFEDPEVAPGVTYYYSVQPVSSNPSCYGFASSCLAVATTACSASALPAPGGVAATATADNEVTVSWSPVGGAASYKVLRTEGGCGAAGPGEAVGLISAPATGLVDRDDLVGGTAYGYRVVASEASCPSCASNPSSCVEVEATGACTVAPQFAGVRSVVSATDGTCRLSIGWEDGAARCGDALTYSVYRSTDPGFQPAPGNLVASEVAGTGWDDYGVAPDVRYFYLVRATDGFGNADANTVRRYEVPAGALSPGSFSDDAGDTAGGGFIAAFAPPSQWAERASDTGNATRVYATTAAGNYQDSACSALESPTLRLGADPDLAFTTRYAIEQGWDGGIVQVATEAGGFADWTRLDSVSYPGVMTGPLGDPACNIPEFADLQPVFTGTSGGLYQANGGTLADWAGQAVRLRFLFSSDTSTTDEGWFLDDLAVDDVMVAGSCTPLDPEPCTEEIDDLDEAVSYQGGWHRRTDAQATGGGYHRRVGSRNGGPAPVAELTFAGDSITYLYVESERGGTADVLIDGQLVDTVVYGPSHTGPENPTFGHSRTWSGLGPGSHRLEILHRTGTVYVDGFRFDCSQPGAGAVASAADHHSETEVSTGSSSEGLVLSRTIEVTPLTEEVSVVVEGSVVPLTVRLRGPAGGLLATGGALLSGGAVSGLDAGVTAPGTYTVQVLNALGAFSRVEISIARTVRVE